MTRPSRLPSSAPVGSGLTRHPLIRSSRLHPAVLLLSLVIVVITPPVAAQDTKAILVLHSYGQDAPGRPPFDLGFARAIREATDVTVDLRRNVRSQPLRQ